MGPISRSQSSKDGFLPSPMELGFSYDPTSTKLPTHLGFGNLNKAWRVVASSKPHPPLLWQRVHLQGSSFSHLVLTTWWVTPTREISLKWSYGLVGIFSTCLAPQKLIPKLDSLSFQEILPSVTQRSSVEDGRGTSLRACC